MALNTSTTIRGALDSGGFLIDTPSGDAIDNVFIFSSVDSTTGKVRRILDGSYRASYAGCFGVGDKTATFQAVLDHAQVRYIIVDTEFTISGSITIPVGKTVIFENGGKLLGLGSITGEVRADYGRAIFASTLNTNGISSATGKVSVEWWSPAGDGIVNDSTPLTKAFSTRTKHVILGKSDSTTARIYNIGNAGNFTSFAVGTIAEFLPNGRIKPGTGNITMGCKIIAHDSQQIIEKTDINARFTTPENSGNAYISVKWTGAVGDNITDDTAAIQVAHNWAINRYSGSLSSRVDTYLPPGKYRCDNIQLFHNLRGSGEFSSVQSFTSGQYALVAGQNVSNFDSGSWVYSYIKDLTVQGDLTSNGITFGNLGVDDQDVGRWVFEAVSWNKCLTAVNKPAGNIGNVFKNCSWTSGQYQYRAVENPSPVMHSGCDYFYDCHFRGATKAAVYIQNSMNGGNHTFLNCIFEYNTNGFAFFVKQYGNALFPLRIMNCYMEGNGTSGGLVNIDGIDYVADVNLYINSAKCVYIDHTATLRMRVLGGSVVHVSNSNMYIDNAFVDTDNTCVITYDKMFGFQCNNNDIITLTPPVSDPDDSARANFNIGLPTSVKSPGGGFIVSRSLQALQPQGGEQPAYNAPGLNVVNDGVLYPTCLEVQVGTVGTNVQILPSVSIPANSFAVCNVALKKISGADAARVDFVNSIGASFIHNGTDWKYFTQIIHTGAGSSAYALAYKGDVVYRMSCAQVHVFSTYQEAYNFCLKNHFASYEMNFRLDVGVKGGRTLIGGNDLGDNLLLSSTNYPTKGIVKIGHGEGLRVHENANHIISIGQDIKNTLAYGTSYRGLDISDISNGGTIAFPYIGLHCTQRDSTGVNDATKILGAIDVFNDASAISVANRYAAALRFRANGGTNTNRGAELEIMLKQNGVTGVTKVFGIDNTGAVTISYAPVTGVSADMILVRDSATGVVKQVSQASISTVTGNMDS